MIEQAAGTPPTCKRVEIFEQPGPKLINEWRGGGGGLVNIYIYENKNVSLSKQSFLGGVQVQSFDVYLFFFQKREGIRTSVPMKHIPSNRNGPPSVRQRNFI